MCGCGCCCCCCCFRCFCLHSPSYPFRIVIVLDLYFPLVVLLCLLVYRRSDKNQRSHGGWCLCMCLCDSNVLFIWTLRALHFINSKFFEKKQHNNNTNNHCWFSDLCLFIHSFIQLHSFTLYTTHTHMHPYKYAPV